MAGKNGEIDGLRTERAAEGEGHAVLARSLASTEARPLRILILTKFRFIGDTLVATPILRAARGRWPDAHITLLSGPAARKLLANNPYLDEIIEFDPTGRDQGLRRFGQILGRLRREHFDIALVLNRSFHSALMPFLAGVPTRSGWRSEGRSWLLTHRTPYDPNKSEIECYFDIARRVAPEIVGDPSLALWLSDDERAEARTLLAARIGPREGRILIGIQPGASLPEKRWPAERFAAVADRLLAGNADAAVVIVGGPDETASAAEMLTALPPPRRERCLNLVGALDLRGSLALLAELSVFISNDTGVRHCAVALGAPTVALFGPTNPRKWGDYGPRHRVIEAAGGVMEAISVGEVAEAATALLATCESSYYYPT